MKETPNAVVQALADREKYREIGTSCTRTSIPAADQLLWRAQSFRHLAHLATGSDHPRNLGVDAALFTGSNWSGVTRG